MEKVQEASIQTYKDDIVSPKVIHTSFRFGIASDSYVRDTRFQKNVFFCPNCENTF